MYLFSINLFINISKFSLIYAFQKCYECDPFLSKAGKFNQIRKLDYTFLSITMTIFVSGICYW